MPHHSAGMQGMHPSRSGSHVVSRDEYLGRLSQARASQFSSVCHHAPATQQRTYSPTATHLSAVGGFLAGAASLRSAQPGAITGNRQDYGLGIAVQPLAAIDHSSGPQHRSSCLDKPPKGRQVKDNFVNRVVDKAGPAVVRIETEQKLEMPCVENSDIFSFFFGVRPHPTQQERKIRGHGSGFCVDGMAGVILTNAHVVQGADRLTVTFPGKMAPMECELLEADEAVDVAAIKIKERPKIPLPSMQLGCSESLRTGDWAIVLGNPFGLQNTCTLGIVSSLDRSTGETGFDWMRHPLLQTDAAVNQGNSGGPMLNENGEVVGMISMRAVCGEGIGFAIPTDSIRSALASILQRKKVPRSYIGLKMTSTPPDTGGRERQGVFVQMVVPRSPAQNAGFEVDDQIVEVEGKQVRQFEEVQMFVRSAKIGARATFKVKRGDSSHTLKIQTADIRQLREAEAKAGKGSSQNRGRVIVMN